MTLLVGGCASVLFIVFILLLLKKIPNDYPKLSETVYNFVAAISIVAAGVWAISTFNILNQRDIAQAQLTELKEKLKNVESSKIELSTEVVNYEGINKDEHSKGVIVKIKIVNVGNTPIEFDVSKSSVKIYQIEAQGVEMGYSKLYEPQIISELAEIGGDSESTPLTSFVSLTSSERVLSYFAVLPKNRMYYIVFSTKPIELKNDGLTKCEELSGCKWFVSKYIYLE